jgi:hypothetical protein
MKNIGFEELKRGLGEGAKIECTHNQSVTKHSILANFAPKLELVTSERNLSDFLFAYFIITLIKGSSTFFMFFHLIF